MQVIKTAGNALWASPLSYLEASTPGTGGWIETANQRLGVRHVLPIQKAADLAQVTVDGAPSKRLSDVANVVEDHQPLIGDSIVKDGPALTLVVEKFPWANTTDVTEEVEAALAAAPSGPDGPGDGLHVVPAGDLPRARGRQPLVRAAHRVGSARRGRSALSC